MSKPSSRKNAKSSNNQLAINRRAKFDFAISEQIEAGIELMGSEVKSIRSGHGNITEAYARFQNGELWLYNATVGHYAPAGESHELTRPRKLLLHRRQLQRMQKALSEQPRATVVPLRMYLNRGMIKVEIGIGVGKRRYDKRQTIKTRDANREIQRALRSANRY